MDNIVIGEKLKINGKEVNDKEFYKFAMDTLTQHELKTGEKANVSAQFRDWANGLIKSDDVEQYKKQTLEKQRIW